MLRRLGDVIDLLTTSLVSIEPMLIFLGDLCDKTPSCALYEGGKSSLKRMRLVIESVRKNPILVKDTMVPGLLTAEMINARLLGVLYGPSNAFADFAKQLAEIENGNGKSLYESIVSKAPTCPNADPNLANAFFAVLCADTGDKSHKYTLSEWDEVIGNFYNSESPFVGIFGFNFLTCRHWKRFEEQERFAGPWNHTFSNPMLLIGNTFDPVTPLASARGTHEAMKSSDRVNSVLLQHDGLGHSSLAQYSKCTVGYIHDYILFGKLPAENTICPVDIPVFRDEISSKALSQKEEDIKIISDVINSMNKQS
jgi:hypothetical protein